jgi:hypothetical protein
MRCASGATTFGRCNTTANRHRRYKPSQCVTRAGQHNRHQRHTPLGGVTVVTLAEVEADLAGGPPKTEISKEELANERT